MFIIYYIGTLTFINLYRKNTNDVESSAGKTFTRGSTGASLRASTRGELGSSMLRRSVQSRKSVNAAKS